MQFISYRTALHAARLPRGTYIFTDLDRLPPKRLQGAQTLWDRIGAAGLAPRRLNEPRRFRHRYELLRHLSDSGLNDVGVWWPEEIDTVTYPVFLRHPVEHGGTPSEVIGDRAGLAAALGAYAARGLGDPLIVEWKPGYDEAGRFVKYGAFRIGERILARHRALSTNWLINIRSVLDEESTFTRELDYMRENPHAEQVMQVFEAAGVEYGRLDYTIAEDGRLRIFEINTNPLLPAPPGMHADDRFNQAFIPALLDAMAAIDTPTRGTGRVAPVFRTPFWRRWRRSPARDHRTARQRQMARFAKHG